LIADRLAVTLRQTLFDWMLLSPTPGIGGFNAKPPSAKRCRLLGKRLPVKASRIQAAISSPASWRAYRIASAAKPRCRRDWVRRQPALCPLVALGRLRCRSLQVPLSGINQTCSKDALRSANDPKRTFARWSSTLLSVLAAAAATSPFQP